MHFFLQRLGFCLSSSFLLCWPMLCSLLSSTTMMADPISFTSIGMDIPVELKKKLFNVWTVKIINVVNVINVIYRCYEYFQCLIGVIIPKLIFKEMVSELLNSWSDISFYQLSMSCVCKLKYNWYLFIMNFTLPACCWTPSFSKSALNWFLRRLVWIRWDFFDTGSRLYLGQSKQILWV